VRRYRRQYGSSGHIWQGRFKSFPCQDDGHLLTVLRYVEQNALRAGLVTRAEDWEFGSLYAAVHPPGPVRLEPVPEAGPIATWVEQVNRPMSEAEVALLRHCIARGRPYGSERWTRSTAAALGLQSSLRPQGRPKKAKK
jgi:putative transposase